MSISYGMDLGSRSVKILSYEDGEISSKSGYDTSEFYRDYGRIVGGELSVSFDRLGMDDVPECVVATGYGRNTVRVKGAASVSEVRAHTAGALYQSGLSDFTLIDIGGQDTKVIKVSGGMVEDFVMNDKCAASSGRYIENMARIIGMDLAEISRHTENPARLSATCAIFGESEIIQKRAEGVPVEQLAAGVNLTIVKRVLPLLARFPDGPVVFSGGVARNSAVAELIRRATGRELVRLAEPAFNGALGCALIAGKPSQTPPRP